MKAMQLAAPGPVARRPLRSCDVPEPTVGPTDVLIAVSVCGVCRTDLHIIEGELAQRRAPLIPGHQIVGRVAACGDAATRFAPGRRVGVAWLHETCGTCRYCVDGAENLCHAARFTGWDVDGGYAEYMVVPEGFAYAIPDAFADEDAAPLLCAGVIGYRALRLSGLKPGRALALYGFGASAHIVIQIARHRGCDVYVFTRSASHRAHARRLGAAWVGTAEDRPPTRVDHAIIFAPAGALVPAALSVLNRGGTVALAGIHMSAIPALDYTRHLYHERTLRSVANATRRDGEELLAVAAELPVQTQVSVFPLERAHEALIALKTGGIDGAAVLRVGGAPGR